MSSGERVWARSTNLEILPTKWAAQRVKTSSLGAEVRKAEWGLPGDENCEGWKG